MAVFIITYDLHPKRGETYTELHDAIKRVGTTWWHGVESTWMVVSNKTTGQIRDELWRHMNPDDQLVVAKATREFAWNGLGQQAADWIRHNYNG